jgi:uncharacterized SAM-binding protein YcdF (DUF218 family)
MTSPNFLTNLLIPLNLFYTLLVFSLALMLLRLRKTAVTVSVIGFAWVLAWSLPITSLSLGSALETRYPQITATDSPYADAIVVLGGNTASGRANWFLPYEKEHALLRTDTAVDLYLAGRAPKVLLSGAALKGEISNARSMAAIIRQQGVPNSALILEHSSRTTYENAALTEEELKANGIRTILLVTSALHMPRAMAAFSKQSVQITAIPTAAQIFLPTDGSVSKYLPNQRALHASRTIIKEYVGLLVYWLRGWV